MYTFIFKQIFCSLYYNLIIIITVVIIFTNPRRFNSQYLNFIFMPTDFLSIKKINTANLLWWFKTVRRVHESYIFI